MSLDLAAGYAALRHGVGAVWLPRDAIMVTGPDAATYLQGQLAQDIDAIGPGVSAWSLVLQPQGKVDALVRVTRHEDGWVLDTDGGWGPAVAARLARFRLRVKVEFEALEWRCLAVRGPRTPPLATALAADWPGFPGVDLLGSDPALPDGVPLVVGEAFEVARIEAGVPVMGAELDERTIPAEAGVVDRSVSFTKGCFTGQELVARIDSRGGNVPRRLRGLVIEGPPPAAGTPLLDGKGAVTSAAWHPAGHAVALAYVRRDVAVPSEVKLEDGRVALVQELPLVS
jgi:tRNA-modifying protein YgfZ